MIATGFGPAAPPPQRARSAADEPHREHERSRAPAEGFEVPDDVLDVPSFLRD